jgi:hypothetical protein
MPLCEPSDNKLNKGNLIIFCSSRILNLVYESDYGLKMSVYMYDTALSQSHHMYLLFA